MDSNKYSGLRQHGEVEVTIIDPDLGEGEFVCANDSIGLSPELPGYSHLWSTGETTENIYVTESGTYYVTVSDPVLGCSASDSIIVSEVPIIETTDIQSACDAYTWIDGDIYTQSNASAVFIELDVLGCDSSIVTLNLTINSSNNGIDTQTACGSYTWIDGNTYTSSNNTATWILTNATGCDSTVTLDLTITNSNVGTDVQTACDTYTWIDGNIYNSSNNTATWVLTNAAGCDSTVLLDLTITNSNTGTDVQNACDSFTWIDGNTYNSSNNSATWVVPNAEGCDSTVTLNLTINYTPQFTLTGFAPSFCNTSDGSISINGLNTNTEYLMSYDSSSIETQNTFISDASGGIIISDLPAGLYNDFMISLNGCQYISTEDIDLNNPGAPVIQNQPDTIVCDNFMLMNIDGENLAGNESYYTESNAGGIQMISGNIINTTQTIYIFDVTGSCTDESSFTVTVNTTPSIINPGIQNVCIRQRIPQ